MICNQLSSNTSQFLPIFRLRTKAKSVLLQILHRRRPRRLRPRSRWRSWMRPSITKIWYDNRARCRRRIYIFPRKTKRKSFKEWKSNEQESERRLQRSKNVWELDSTEGTKALRIRKKCCMRSQSQKLMQQQRLHRNYRKEWQAPFRLWFSRLRPRYWAWWSTTIQIIIQMTTSWFNRSWIPNWKGYTRRRSRTPSPSWPRCQRRPRGG